MNYTCLITGASSGIGRQLALHYADNGWTVYAVARSKDKLDELAKNERINALPLDLTDNNAIKHAATQLQQDGVVSELLFHPRCQSRVYLRDHALGPASKGGRIRRSCDPCLNRSKRFGWV